MSKRPPPPSAHDVARLAGLSQAAVSRAFTPGASIAAPTRQRVLEAAQALGYHPNLMARSLIKGRSAMVGVVIGNHRYPFFLAALHALSARLSQAGKHMLVASAEGNTTVDRHVEGLLNYRVDTVLLMGANVSPGLAEQCREKGVPMISFTRPARRMRGFASVTGDHVGGSASIAAHLLEQGYRRLAVMAGLAGSVSTRDREAGFYEYLAAQGLGMPERVVGAFDREAAHGAARQLLSAPERPDAIYCANDDMALSTIEVARHEFGLEIGRDLGVAGFDNIEQAAWPSFSLTTYALPVDEVIDAVMGILLSPDGAEAPALTIVDGELKVRGSTRRG